MDYSNVKLWFAKDSNGDIVTINDVNENNRDGKYSCPICGSSLRPKAVKSKQVTSHFAHVDSSKCSESMIHWWFKHKFLEKGDTFTVVSDKEHTYVCKDVLVEQSYAAGDVIYKPDVTVITECGNTIYFEMAFSNKKKVKDYLDIWLELKDIVVEVDIKQLLTKDDLPSFNALFYEGKCFNVKRNDAYYNTIGKYKEEKLKDENIKKIKGRIKKLDWFWEELFKYKKDEISLEMLTDIINYIDIEDIDLVIQILKKQKCVDVCEEFIHKRANHMLHKINDAINLRLVSKFINVKQESIIKYNKLQTITIKIKHGYQSHTIDVLKESDESIISRINRKANNIIVENFLKGMREYYNRYGICIWFSYDEISEIIIHVVNDVYDNFNLDVIVPDQIINSNNTNIIENFIKDEINRLITGLHMPIKFIHLHDFLKKVKNLFNEQLIRKEKIVKGYEITHTLELDFRIINDKIEVNLKAHGLPNSNRDIHLLLNEIYNENKEIDFTTLGNIISDNIVLFLYSHYGEYKCCECEKFIKLHNKDIKYYLDNGFELPKRCKSCRDKRKQERLKGGI